MLIYSLIIKSNSLQHEVMQLPIHPRQLLQAQVCGLARLRISCFRDFSTNVSGSERILFAVFACIYVCSDLADGVIDEVNDRVVVLISDAFLPITD